MKISCLERPASLRELVQARHAAFDFRFRFGEIAQRNLRRANFLKSSTAYGWVSKEAFGLSEQQGPRQLIPT
jgi:hypothetical protein